MQDLGLLKILHLTADNLRHRKNGANYMLPDVTGYLHSFSLTDEPFLFSF